MVVAGGLICTSADLQESGEGVRFELSGPDGRPVPAFVVRYQGEPRAFLNQCAHVPVELDWVPGRFFDFDRNYLICATHGALYHPVTGRCVAGPCRGASLQVVRVFEAAGEVCLAAASCD